MANGIVPVALAIGPGLFPVAAQRGLAQRPRAGFRAIEKHPFALVRCAHLQPGERAVHCSVIKFGGDRREAG